MAHGSRELLKVRDNPHGQMEATTKVHGLQVREMVRVLWCWQMAADMRDTGKTVKCMVTVS
jgi:hypothetical protein